MGERNCDERKGFVYFPVFFSVLSLSKLGKSFQPTTTTTHNIFSPSHSPWILPLQLWGSNEFVAHGSAVIWVLWAVRDRLWSLSGWSEVTALELSWATKSSHLITQMWHRTTGRDQPHNMPTIAPKLWLGRNMDCKHWTSHWANIRLRGPGGDLQFSVLDLMY